MNRSTLIVAFAAPWLAVAAAAQTPSTPTAQSPSTPVQVSTGPASAPPPVQTSTGPATSPAAPVNTSTAPASSGADAWRPGKGIWHKDCDGDVAKFCPGVTTREQVEQCLRTNEKRLSPACQNIREKEGHRRHMR